MPGGMNGSGSLSGSVTASLSGQQLASAIPSPTAGKSWRSKSMNLKHSATSSMLPSPTGSSTDGSDASKLGLGGGGGGSGGPQRSMLDKFRLINPRSASRASPSVAEMALQEEDDLSEYGEDSPVPAGPICNSTASSTQSKHVANKTTASSLTPPNKASPSTSSSSSSFSKSSSGSGGSSRSASRDKDEKSKSGRSKESSPPKDERDSFGDTAAKKTSKVGSLIPKGGKPVSGKKDSSGIPKPGLKAPLATAHNPKAQSQPQVQGLNSSGNLRGGGSGDGERAKLMKGGGGQGGSFYMQRSIGGPMEGKRTSMTSSTSTSALSGSSGTLGGGGGGGGGGAAVGGNGVVQLPQQQQHNHPNTATVAPFLYR